MIDLTSLAIAIITLCVVFITSVALPLARAKWGAENVNEFLSWVRIAVTAAEQIYDVTQGAQKKRYVLEFLHSRGYKVDEEEVNIAIEAAVLELHTELYGVTTNGTEAENKRVGFADC